MATGNGAAWIILPAVVSAVVIAVLAALRVSCSASRDGALRHTVFWEFMTLTMIDGMDAAERPGLPADPDEDVGLRHARASLAAGVHDVVERCAADSGREGPGAGRRCARVLAILRLVVGGHRCRHHAGRRRWPAMLIGTTRMKCSGSASTHD